MLTHHKLKVYEEALALGGCAEDLSASCGRRHAIVDHFRRASESIVLNIAEGARLACGPGKIRALDYALGSSLECAACLDIAQTKGCLSPESLRSEKERLLEITRMLVGLRKAWLQLTLHEEPGPYRAKPCRSDGQVLFHHESLDVYQVALEFMRWFVGLPGAKELSDRLCREIDHSATSLILNIAEGNGRYSELDHRRFLEIVASSAVKAAAYLDLYQQKLLSADLQTNHGRELLSRTVAMLCRF
jgi:four helix bundle protein